MFTLTYEAQDPAYTAAFPDFPEIITRVGTRKNAKAAEEIMSDIKTIQAKLTGPPEARQRRAELIAELWQVFCDSGPAAVGDELTRRMNTLAGDFDAKLRELKDQL